MSSIEDRRLKALAEQGRQWIEESDRERFGARWDDYCAGRLSEGEAAALIVASEDPDAPLAASLFKPLDAQVKAALVERLQQEIFPQDASAQHALPPELAQKERVQEERARAPSGQEDLRNAGGPPPPHRHERSGLGGLWDGFSALFLSRGLPQWGLAMGLASGILLVLSLPLMRKDLGPLPLFQPKVEGVQTARSAGDGRARTFQAGHHFEIMLRPEQAVDGSFVTSVMVQSSNGEIRRWRDAELALVRSQEGVVFTEGTIWPWGAGDWTVHFFVTRKSLKDKELRNILQERNPGPDGATKLSDGYWLQERIHVLP